MLSRFLTWTVTGAVLYAFSTAVILFRLHERRQRANFKSSDYWTIAAWLGSTFFTAAVLYSAHVDFLRPTQFSEAQHAIANYLFAVSLTVVVPVTKISILLLFLELTPGVWHARCLQGLLMLIAMTLATFTAITIFGCQVSPTGHIWSLLDPSGVHKDYSTAEVAGHVSGFEHKCVPQVNVILSNSFINVLYELAIFILALPFIWKLRTGFSQKFGLLVAFMLGFFTIAASLVFSIHSSRGYRLLLQGKPNPSDFFIGGLWGIAEVNAGLAFASLLPIRGVLIKFVARQFSALGLTRKVSLNSRVATQDDFMYADELQWPMKNVQFPNLNEGLRRASVSVIAISTTRIKSATSSPFFRGGWAKASPRREEVNQVYRSGATQEFDGFTFGREKGGVVEESEITPDGGFLPVFHEQVGFEEDSARSHTRMCDLDRQRMMTDGVSEISSPGSPSHRTSHGAEPEKDLEMGSIPICGPPSSTL